MKKLVQKIKDTLSILNSGKGFTLLELLVVVLIIGILAAIAIPQYKKAITKTKLAELDVIVNAARKNIENYLMIHDYPASGTVYFTGTKRTADDIEMPGDCDSFSSNCITKLLNYRAYCSSKNCIIDVVLLFLNGEKVSIQIDKEKKKVYINNIWYLYKANAKETCQWAQDNNYPGHSNKAYTTCKDLGITLKEYKVKEPPIS